MKGWKKKLFLLLLFYNGKTEWVKSLKSKFFRNIHYRCEGKEIYMISIDFKISAKY